MSAPFALWLNTVDVLSFSLGTISTYSYFVFVSIHVTFGVLNLFLVSIVYDYSRSTCNLNLKSMQIHLVFRLKPNLIGRVVELLARKYLNCAEHNIPFHTHHLITWINANGRPAIKYDGHYKFDTSTSTTSTTTSSPPPLPPRTRQRSISMGPTNLDRSGPGGPI